MALSGAEYLIAVMAAFSLFFVVLVLFLFSEMTRSVITRTELLPLPSATFMAKEGPSYGRGVGLPWVGPWAQRWHWHGLPGFIPPIIAPQNPAIQLLGREEGFGDIWPMSWLAMSCPSSMPEPLRLPGARSWLWDILLVYPRRVPAVSVHEACFH